MATILGFSPAQIEDYSRLRATVAAMARQLGFDLTDIENGEAHEANFQLVQCTSETADGDGNFAGVRVTDSPSGMEDQLACLVRPATSGQAMATDKTYLGRMRGYVGANAVFTVADVPSPVASGWTWTATKTADYTAAVGEAVPVNQTGGTVQVTLPANPAKNDRVLIAVVAYHATNTARVITSGSDKLNGNVSSSDAMLGFGSWEFVWSGDSSIGWVCSRGFNHAEW